MSQRAKKRGLPQMGTLGAGNHYAEVQVVDEIHDAAAARKMGIDRLGQVGLPQEGGGRCGVTSHPVCCFARLMSASPLPFPGVGMAHWEASLSAAVPLPPPPPRRSVS